MRYTHRTSGGLADRLGDRSVNVMILRAKGYRMPQSYYVRKGWLVPLSESSSKPEDVEESVQESQPDAGALSEEAAAKPADAPEPSRVHEWAKLWGVTAKDVQKAASEAGVEAKNHLSTISREEAAEILEALTS